MLLEARRCCKRFATVRAGMGTSPNMLRANVPLKVTGVCEHLLVEGTTNTHCRVIIWSLKIIKWTKETELQTNTWANINGCFIKQSFQKPSLYLWAVFTFVVLATVVWHLMSDQVWFPVEGLGTLVTLIFPLLRVWQNVGLHAKKKQRETKTRCQQMAHFISLQSAEKVNTSQKYLF